MSAFHFDPLSSQKPQDQGRQLSDAVTKLEQNTTFGKNNFNLCPHSLKIGYQVLCHVDQSTTSTRYSKMQHLHFKIWGVKVLLKILSPYCLVSWIGVWEIDVTLFTVTQKHSHAKLSSTCLSPCNYFPRNMCFDSWESYTLLYHANQIMPLQIEMASHYFNPPLKLW